MRLFAGGIRAIHGLKPGNLVGGKMYFSKNMACGMMASIIVRAHTESRLRKKCFRGATVRKAGNFTAWSSSEEVFTDEVILKEFILEMSELWKEKDFDTYSVEITCPNIVGWGSTAPLKDYTLDVLESFSLNPSSVGLRVKQSRTDIRAPKTNLITIVFEFKSEDDKPVAIVHSMYSGEDLGDLDGNVTAREKRIFFGWNHPGV